MTGKPPITDVEMYGKAAEIFGKALTAQAPYAYQVSQSLGVASFLVSLGSIFMAIGETIDEISKLDDQDEAKTDGV